MTTPEARHDEAAGEPRGFVTEAFEARARSLGREAEDAARRLSTNPSAIGLADMTARVWGVVLLGFGLWFLADVTLAMDLPRVAWQDLWPLTLIVVGLMVVVSGATRRR